MSVEDGEEGGSAFDGAEVVGNDDGVVALLGAFGGVDGKAVRGRTSDGKAVKFPLITQGSAARDDVEFYHSLLDGGLGVVNYNDGRDDFRTGGEGVEFENARTDGPELREFRAERSR